MVKPTQGAYYDVIIIGAGIAGLVNAALLSKCGLKVAVIEKEPHAGGYLAGYQKKGYRFDTAIHWLNQCSPNGFVTKIFDFLGQDYPVCKSLTKIRRNKGETIDCLITNNPDSLQNELIKQYPEEKNGIEKFFKSARKIGASFDKFSTVLRSEETMSIKERLLNKMRLLKFALPFIPYLSYSGEKKMTKGLNKFFKNQKLHQIFSPETDLLSCLVPIGWAYFGDYQTPPEGGGQVIPEWLQHIATSYNNDIFFNCEATEILVKNGISKGIKVNSRGASVVLKSEFVVAACDLSLVYNHLLNEDLIDEKEKKKLKNAEVYSSSFTLSIALNCPAEDLGFGEEMVHLFKEDIPKEAYNNGNPATSALTILAPSVTDKSLAPEGCGTLVIFMPAYIHQYNSWYTEPGFKRGGAYETLKKEITEQLITRVELMAPNIRQHIVFADAATPITHWRYTGNAGGTMMGTKPNKKNMQSKVAKYKTDVKKLLIGGHWAELGGGVPIAAKAAVNAALLILKDKNTAAFETLVKYFDGQFSREDVIGNKIFKPYNNNWQRRPTAAEKMNGRNKSSSKVQ